MTEHRNRPHKPTLDDYRAMMSETHAPNQLKEAVLSQAQARRDEAHRGSTTRPAARSVDLFGTIAHRRIKAFAMAACLILLVGVGTTALALNAPTGLDAGAKENSVTLCTEHFEGGHGYSGAWYNPADDTFWNYAEWAGYKYHFPLYCTGDNIESITYEIEGERAYFEVIDTTVTAEQHANGVHTYNYLKSVTFDYDHQESIDEARIVEIYIGFPLSESGSEAYRSLMNEGHSTEAKGLLDAAIEQGAAQELSGTILRLTATFTDGSAQTKSYLIDAPNLDDPTHYTFTEIAEDPAS